MANPQLESLKYPVGRFKSPESINPADRTEWIQALKTLPNDIKTVINSWNEDQINTAYRPEGWTVSQLIHHIADSHINSIVRFKLGLTEDNPTIKPYAQAKWAELSDVKQLSHEISLSILDGVHKRFVCLLENMTDEDYERTIFHPEMNVTMSLHALLAMYGWHSKHHLAHITELAKRKKLVVSN